MAQVPGLPHAPLEKGPIDRLGRERPVGREIRKMDDEPGAKIVAVGVEREQLHPARVDADQRLVRGRWQRSEEHTSELQSLMRISYAVFCLKKKKLQPNPDDQTSRN